MFPSRLLQVLTTRLVLVNFVTGTGWRVVVENDSGDALLEKSVSPISSLGSSDRRVVVRRGGSFTYSFYAGRESLRDGLRFAYDGLGDRSC